MGREWRGPSRAPTSAGPAPTGTLHEARPAAAGSYRRGAVRVAAWHGAVGPLVVTLYAAVTWDGQNRPAMVAISVVLLLIAAVVQFTAGRATAGPRSPVATLAGVYLYIVGFAALAFLDGGVHGPLGSMVFYLSAFIAITVPRRAFLPIAIGSVAAFGVVALLGPDAPPGYALSLVCSFGVVNVVLARYASALASLRRRLTEISQVDPLTNCLNRRGFDDRLAEELSLADRTGRPCSLITIDLDAFKAVNDTFGHHVGDDLLALTGQILKSTVPPPHAVARLGGDEFAVILPDLGAEAAAALADDCRRALNDASPASTGHASYPSEAADLGRLHALADRRLYADKGRRAGDDAQARTVVDRTRPPTNPTRVSSNERKQRSVADIGLVAAVNFAVGSAYALTAPGPLDVGLVAVLLPGLVIGAAAAGLSGVIVRHRTARRLWTVAGPLSLVLAHVAAIMDGGGNSVIYLGTVNTLTVIALALPRRIFLMLAAAATSSYLAIAVLIGAPSPWYVGFNLLGVILVSATCTHQAEVAGRGRRLLTRLSRVDGLTGCLNRRGFEERFDEELQRARRNGAALSLAVIDLDKFKAVNDTLGHAAGDELLTWVGTMFDATTRAHDVVGRLGGDEFIALLPGCPAGEAAVLADRIAIALSPRTGVSVGTATLGVDGDDLDSLYRHADAALFAQKARRRTAGPVPPAPLDRLPG